MPQSKRILVVSYYTNIPGACQAEWVDDKIRCYLKEGYSVTLISSICAIPYSMDGVNHIRVPSLSLHDFRDERQRMHAFNIKTDTYLYFFMTLVYTLGFLLDRLQYLLTKGIGEGRWSWLITSFPVLLAASIRYGAGLILSTGGPASGHLSSIIVGKITRKPVVVELQDPLSGSDIGRNQQAAGYLYKVEKFIVKYADKTVYVTRAAAEYARKLFGSEKISYEYPSAWDFGVAPGDREGTPSSKLKMVHLGSLYATRNFDSIISAVDRLIEEGAYSPTDIELLNLGHVSHEIREKISTRPYVKILPPLGRVDALKVAAESDVMLLIQNSDARSQVTIPYKTYDYLNIGNKILAILNSQELTELIEGAGHLAYKIEDIDGIARGLKKLLSDREPVRPGTSQLNAIHQAEKLISLK